MKYSKVSYCRLNNSFSFKYCFFFQPLKKFTPSLFSFQHSDFYLNKPYKKISERFRKKFHQHNKKKLPVKNEIVLVGNKKNREKTIIETTMIKLSQISTQKSKALRRRNLIQIFKISDHQNNSL